MQLVRMVTAIPRDIALKLRENERIVDYNTLPQLHPKLIESIRDYFESRVGYRNSPIACLSRVSHKDSTIQNVGTSVCDFIPVKANDSVILELKMPEDCIVSIDYGNLLRFSSELTECKGDTVAEHDVMSYFEDYLQVGLGEDTGDTISFIPFIEMEKCQFFAILNSSFDMTDFDLPGIQQINLRELNSFF